MVYKVTLVVAGEKEPYTQYNTSLVPAVGDLIVINKAEQRVMQVKKRMLDINNTDDIYLVTEWLPRD